VGDSAAGLNSPQLNLWSDEMSKSKSKGGGTKKSSDRRWNIIALAIVAAVVIGTGNSWWGSAETGSTFKNLLATDGGKSIISKIKTFPSLGQRHLQPGGPYSYPDAYPTSGPHDPIWAAPGFYTSSPPQTKLVHALEHGNVVIYYDKPGEKALDTLKSWASIYTGQWDGIVVTPRRGIGQTVVLTAWTKKLTLDNFDPASAAKFIDLYRGRGPENPMR